MTDLAPSDANAVGKRDTPLSGEVEVRGDDFPQALTKALFMTTGGPRPPEAWVRRAVAVLLADGWTVQAPGAASEARERELLEALRCALAALEYADQTSDVRGAQLVARAAIAKAEGR